MDTLALSLTKAITDLLEQSEKRFHAQQTKQEAQANLIADLGTRLANLEIRCQELKDENDSLKEELKLSTNLGNEETTNQISLARSQIEKHVAADCDSLRKELKLSKLKGDETAKEICGLKSHIEKLQKQSDEYEGWEKLISIMADKIKSFDDFKDRIDVTLKDIIDNQNGIAKEVKRHRQKLVENSLRPTVRSPSTSTLLNGSNNNMHGSMGRLKQPTKYYDHHSSNNFFSESPDEELSQLSDHAEILKKGVDALNDLQRSFERNSFLDD